METFKKILHKLLFPHMAIIMVLVLVSAAALIYTFISGKTETVIAYGIYTLSAYALTVICIRSSILFRKAKDFKENNQYIQRYLTDVHLRIKISLYISVCMNMLYAMMQLISGFLFDSIWFYALAGYYVILAAMRYFLLKETRKEKPGEKQFREWLHYRFCGILLLFMNLALGVIVAYIVWLNRGFEHGEIMTIAMAAYTFYTMITACIHVVKYRRYESPLLSAAKAINLAAALVSMLSLETAMLTAFGAENGREFRRIMTGVTGSGVCALVLALAIYMIIHSTKEIKRMKKEVQKSE